MKLKYLLHVILLLIGKHAFSQCDSTFFRLATTKLSEVIVIDTNRLIAAGDNGYIIKSSDGGRIWRNIPTFTSYHLTAISQATDSVMYTAGHFRTILKSEDQGETWFPLYIKLPVNSSLAANFKDVDFINADTGFVVESFSYLHKTTDGGRSWKDTVFSVPQGGNLQSITLVNDTLGFLAAGRGGLYRTVNAGKTWNLVIITSPPGEINQVKFLDAQVGFALGNNTLYRTTNGGTTWTEVSLPVGGNYTEFIFLNQQTGFVAANNSNFLLKTTDAGVTWNAVYILPGFVSVATTDPLRKKIVFVGGNRTVLSTSDAGQSFKVLGVNAVGDHQDVMFLNDSVGYLSGGSGRVYKTIDKAETWKPLADIFTGYPSQSVYFINEQYGFVAKDNIFRTLDSGKTWTPTTVPEAGQTFYAAKRIHFYTPAKGIVMNNYSVYHTHDTGATWTLALSSSYVLHDLSVKPNGEAFVSGHLGKLYKSTNEGLTWSPSNIATTDDLTTIYFYNNSIGYMGTADSALFKTIDGGNSWNKIYDSELGRVIGRTFFFVNDSIGYHGRDNGSGGALYETKNGGHKWKRIQIQDRILKLHGKSTVYGAGQNGILIKTERASLPSIPGYIYGPELNCENGISLFQTGAMDSVKYHWSLSGGGVQKLGGRFDTIHWNAQGLRTLSVSVSNACGMSAARSIEVLVQPETVITSNPQSISVCSGSSASFSVIATGDSLKYQWKKNGNLIPGAVNTTLTIPVVSDFHSGNYSVTVTGLCGNISSAIATLSMKPVAECVTALPALDFINGNIMLLPNPVKDRATLKISSVGRKDLLWMITDISGRVILKIPGKLSDGDNNIEFSLGSLPPGVYSISGITSKFTTPAVRFVKVNNR